MPRSTNLDDASFHTSRSEGPGEGARERTRKEGTGTGDRGGHASELESNK